MSKCQFHMGNSKYIAMYEDEKSIVMVYCFVAIDLINETIDLIKETIGHDNRP